MLDLRSRLDDPRIRELLAYAVGFPTSERLGQVCRRYCSEPGWRLCGVEVAGSVVGCIGLEVTGPMQAIIQHIAVAPAARRKGIGRTLLQQATAGLGLTHLTAETDADAVGFYRRCGFAVESLGEVYAGVERFRCEWKQAL